MRCPNGRDRKASTIASVRSSRTRTASPGRSGCRIPCSRRCGGISTIGSWSSSPPPSRATTWFRGFWWPCRSTRSAARPEVAASGKIRRDEVETVGEDRVDAPGKQTPDGFRVVGRIAEQPIARAANLFRLRGRQVFAVAVHGDAPERLRGIAPIRLDPVGEKSAIELRRGRACRLESDALERREQRRGRGAAPQLQRELRGGGARFALESLSRLDLDVGPQAELDAQLPGPLERGHALAAVFGAEPGAGVQACEPRVGRGGNGAPPVGGALERLVVDQHRDLVGRKHHVEFDAAETHRRGLAKARQGVLRRKRAAAAVSHHSWMRPGSLHASDWSRGSDPRTGFNYRYGKRLANSGSVGARAKKNGGREGFPRRRRLLGRRATWRRPADARVGGRHAIRAMTASYHHARCGNKPDKKKLKVNFPRTL